MGVVTGLKRVIRAVVPHIIVLSLLAGYLILGAVVFSLLETGSSDVNVFETDIQHLKDKYGASTESTPRSGDSGAVPMGAIAPADGMDLDMMMEEVLNSTFRPGWKIGRMQAVQSNRAWSFASSMLFCMTTITTIGYGDVVPVTVAGKAFCVLYSAIGIPLCVLYMAGVGSFLAHVILTLCRILKIGQPITRALCCCCAKSKKQPISRALCCCCTKNKQDEKYDLGRGNVELEEKQNLSSVKKKKKKASQLDNNDDTQDMAVVTRQHNLESGAVEYQDEMEAPVLLVLAILIGYMCAGAFVMSRIENWTYWNGLYFTYITLTTIGFGDYVPMMLYKEDAYIVCVIYVLIGLAVMSMCITLVQAKVRRLGNQFWDCIGF